MTLRSPGLLHTRRHALGLLTGAGTVLGARGLHATCLPSGFDGAGAGEASVPAANQAGRAPAATIFLDVSGSMAGYVARTRPAPGRPAPGRPVQPAPGPEAGAPRTFNDLVQSLPQLSAAIADRISLFSFGKSIKPIGIADLSRAARPEFYNEPDSRIQDALVRMDSLPKDEIGLLVTDLFLTGDEIFGGAGAIRSPLARIIESGRSVALMGIRSGFAGTVYDIPVVRNYAGASERPFYLLASGPPPLLARLVRRIETELLDPLPPTPDGQPRHHAVLFGFSPLPALPAALAVTTEGAAEALPVAPLDLPSTAASVRFPAGAGGASATVPLASLAEAHALLPDRFRLDQSLWLEPPRSGGRAACPERWVQARSFPPVLQFSTGADGAPLLKLGGPLLGRLTPGVVFLARGRVIATGLSDTPAQTAWVRDWNLEARDAEAYVAGRPQMFRTLNLREIVSMLEGLVRDRMTETVVAELLLAIQVPRR